MVAYQRHNPQVACRNEEMLMSSVDRQILIYGTAEEVEYWNVFFINSPGLYIVLNSCASSLGWPTLRVPSGLGCSV